MVKKEIFSDKIIWTVNPVETGNIMEQIRNEIASTFPPHKKMSAAIVFEEIFTNVAKYAYEESLSKPLEIVLEIRANGWRILTFTDYGKKFNPVSYIPSDTDGKQIGGHGIRLVRELSKKITYERCDKKNILKISMR